MQAKEILSCLKSKDNVKASLYLPTAPSHLSSLSMALILEATGLFPTWTGIPIVPLPGECASYAYSREIHLLLRQLIKFKLKEIFSLLTASGHVREQQMIIDFRRSAYLETKPGLVNLK